MYLLYCIQKAPNQKKKHSNADEKDIKRKNEERDKSKTGYIQITEYIQHRYILLDEKEKYTPTKKKQVGPKEQQQMNEPHRSI